MKKVLALVLSALSAYTLGLLVATQHALLIPLAVVCFGALGFCFKVTGEP